MTTKRQVLAVFLKEISWGYAEHRHATMAAAMAFRSLFSAIPFMVVFVLIYDWLQRILTINDLPMQWNARNSEWMMEAAKKELETLNFFNNQPLAWLLGLLLVIYGASTVFRELNLALELIFGSDKKGFFKVEFYRRMAAFGLVFGLAFMLFLAVMGAWFLDSIVDLLANTDGPVVVLLLGLNRSLLPVLTFALLACVYKWVPRLKMSFRDIWLGALMATVLFWVGQLIMGGVLSQIDINSAYGAAGSLIMFLLWSYYTALAVLLGAEVVRVRYNTHRKGK